MPIGTKCQDWKLRVILLALISLALCCAVAAKGPRNSDTYRLDFHYSVFALATNTWSWNDSDADHWGTAFVVDRQGTILTADHVVKDLLAIVEAHIQQGHSGATLYIHMHWQNGGRSVPLKVVLQREDLDIAVLQPLVPIDSPERHGDAPPFEPLDLDPRAQVNITEPVYIVGYPINAAPYLEEEKREFPPGSDKFFSLVLQTDPSVTTATIAGVGHRLAPPTAQTKGRYLINQNFLLLNHPGGPGNSGGPVVSAQSGKVIGMLTRSSGGYSFAVPTAEITAVLNELRATKP